MCARFVYAIANLFGWASPTSAERWRPGGWPGRKIAVASPANPGEVEYTTQLLGVGELLEGSTSNASHRASLPIAAVLSGGFGRELLSKAEWTFDGVEQLVGEIDTIDEYFSD